MQEMMFRAFNLPESAYADLLGDADEQVAMLHGMLPLSETDEIALESYDEAFLVRFTYNSAAIEGSTLTLADTELVLEGEFMPSDAGNKRLRDVFAARGIAEGCEYAQRALECGRVLSEELVKDIHERTALDCQPRTRGSYRTTAVYISGSETVPASAPRVRELMADLVFACERSDEPAIVKAAAFHAMFEAVHPFQDGNGRTGRILLNYMLEQAGYPPIAIKASLRSDYLRALEDWQVRDDPRPLIASVARCIAEEASARRRGLEETRAATVSAAR